MKKQTMLLAALLIALTIAAGSHYTLYAGTFDPDIERINFSIENAVTGGPAIAGTLAGVASTQAKLTNGPDPATPPLEGPDAQVVPAVAELSITKVADAESVIAGEQITYTITVTNSGDTAAAFVFTGDTLPDGTTFDSAASSPECAQGEP
ncbi:MAG: DUF11 domain-containing protein, partial [Chloroflexi bacterium]|nr:DUF11 domain-containing protein [Chloroflexota bacterium]